MMMRVTKTQNRFRWFLGRQMMPGILFVLAPGLALGQNQFHLQEATIGGIHNAIKEGQITCQGLVESYINRAKAYNGVCTQLVTRDGAPSRAFRRRGGQRVSSVSRPNPPLLAHGFATRRSAGWPMALAVGDANRGSDSTPPRLKRWGTHPGIPASGGGSALAVFPGRIRPFSLTASPPRDRATQVGDANRGSDSTPPPLKRWGTQPGIQASGGAAR